MSKHLFTCLSPLGRGWGRVQRYFSEPTSASHSENIAELLWRDLDRNVSRSRYNVCTFAYYEANRKISVAADRLFCMVEVWRVLPCNWCTTLGGWINTGRKLLSAVVTYRLHMLCHIGVVVNFSLHADSWVCFTFHHSVHQWRLEKKCPRMHQWVKACCLNWQRDSVKL